MKRLKPLIGRCVDARSIKPPAKTADPIYSTPAYQTWREIIIERAARRCEHVDPSSRQRCPKAEPQHRLFADHIIEISDGGAPFDPANGRCLCGSHHTFKTARARAERLGRPAR